MPYVATTRKRCGRPDCGAFLTPQQEAKGRIYHSRECAGIMRTRNQTPRMREVAEQNFRGILEARRKAYIERMRARLFEVSKPFSEQWKVPLVEIVKLALKLENGAYRRGYSAGYERNRRGKAA
jgi:hypothetical protein